MTNEEIIKTDDNLSASVRDDLLAIARTTDVEKLIAGMRDDLTLIAGTTDVEKLIALVNEKAPRMSGSILQMIQLGVRDWGPAFDGLAVMMAYAEMAERRPDYKAKLIETVAKQAPIISSGLDKFAQALRENAGEPK